MASTAAAAGSERARSALAAEAARRRTFAIISHPDAGKTTLTEKLLLYAGAVTEAGQVKARRNRRSAVSDWMELERDRGISITSTALRFSVLETTFNLLDTPGHRDFSEDTLRVLAAADSAVMLLDAARGIEEQTRKLFQVARERRIPLITFVNKLDRPAREPLELIDEIEAELGIVPAAVTWPVGMADEFRGVLDRRDGSFHRFARTAGGATPALEEQVQAGGEPTDDPAWHRAEEELALLEGASAELDVGEYLAARATPVFFGSAISNFGVRLLLEALAEIAPAPRPRETADGGTRSIEAPFAGQVFKLQANLDPRHRDRLAFVRVCSGRFERGMKATNARTGKPVSLSYAHELFGQDRQTLEEAYPGDIVGLINRAELQVGDTLHTGGPVRFPPFPTLAPDLFMRVRNVDTGRYKQYHRGLRQLEQEGVIHVLHHLDRSGQELILAGIGPMQFEVAAYRMQHEFGAEIGFDPAPWTVSRRTDAAGAEALRRWRGEVLGDEDGTLLAVFASEFLLERFQRDEPDVLLDPLLVGS